MQVRVEGQAAKPEQSRVPAMPGCLLSGKLEPWESGKGSELGGCCVLWSEGMHELCGLGEELCGEEALSFECPDWVLRSSGLGVQVETES